MFCLPPWDSEIGLEFKFEDHFLQLESSPFLYLLECVLLYNTDSRKHELYFLFTCPMKTRQSCRKNNRVFEELGSEPSKTARISKKDLRTLAAKQTHRKGKHGNRSTALPVHETGEFVEGIDPSHFSCPICMELLLVPFSLTCGHVFCFGCLDNLAPHEQVNNHCPCCRNSIDEHYPTRSRILETLLQWVVSKLPAQQKKSYQTRTQNSLKKFEQRSNQYNDISINQNIDFKLGNHWEVGIVKGIYSARNVNQIELQSKKDQQRHVFSHGSPHLAKYLTFTKNMQMEIIDLIHSNQIRAAQLNREIRTRIYRRRSIFDRPGSAIRERLDRERTEALRERTQALRDEVFGMRPEAFGSSSVFLPEGGVSFFDRAQIEEEEIAWPELFHL